MLDWITRAECQDDEREKGTSVTIQWFGGGVFTEVSAGGLN